MVKFCEMCDALLTANIHNDKLTFNCPACLFMEPAKPPDTLLYEYVKEPDVSMHDTVLDNAVDDPTIMKARVNCADKRCPGRVAKQVRIYGNMKLYNICTTCRKPWLSGAVA